MSFTKSTRNQSKLVDDSFVVSDSDEEAESSSRWARFNTPHKDTRVIRESDSESENSKHVELSADESSDKTDFSDSEEEDRQFMNTSHKVSIIEHSSEQEESESENEELKINKLKRRSIYDNPVNSPTPSSTPIHSHLRKKAKKAIIYSDSDSEGMPDVHMKPLAKRNQRNLIELSDEDTNIETYSNKVSDDSKSKEDEDDNQMDTSEGESSNYQECSNNSDALKKSHMEVENITNDNSLVKDLSNSKDSNMDNDSEISSISNMNKNGARSLTSKNSSFQEKKSSAKNVIDLTINDSIHDRSTKRMDKSEKNEKVVDLTMNEPRDSHLVSRSMNKSLRKEEKSSSDEVIVCNSTTTSESEIDQEAIALAKKEIGVGNIDYLEAQRKEHLLLNMDSLQKQLNKLNKFAASVDINALPDKGAKVHETIRQHEHKIASLKAELAKLSRKTITSVPQKVQTPKIKAEPKVNVKAEKSLISPLVDNKVNNIKNELKKNDNDKFSDQFNVFDVHDIPKVPQTSFDAAELGKKALATLNKQQSLTHQRLEQLHGSLTSRPSDDQREKDPSGLKVPLMSHQQHALAWMKWREKQKPKGGILADDMGLGKTLTMISLVLATVDQRANDSDESSSDDEWLSRNKRKRYYGGTLVVCPASLIKQWEAEVKNRVRKGLLSVLVFHGNNRSIEDRKISKYNIVVTTYQTLVREADAETGMYRMEWNRVILDEAHYIRNHKSKACIAACGLNAKHRWALTGTPIQNKEMDLYAILKFLKCSPFDDFQVWKRWVDNKNDAGKQRLITIMKTLMLRRTKQELQSKGNLESLPEKFLELVEIDMDREEDLVYKKILLFSQNLFAQFLSQRAEKQHMRELYGGKFDRPSLSSLGSKTNFTKAQKMLLEHHSTNIEAHEILVLLLRLRQMCCHPALIHAMLDKQDAELNGIEEEDVNSELLNKLHNMSINEEEEVEEHVANFKIDERVTANLLTQKNPVFNNDRQSSKVRAILKTIEEVLDKGDKLIVVSQWTSFLKVIAKHLDDMEDAKYAMFTGEVAVKNRQAIVDKLNDPREDVNILLLSLTAGGVGLNLIGANHLLLTDIHWNPQLEAQAQDRIYRFGQKKDVYVYKYMCKDTIEERVKNLQDKKLEIANHVLTGTRSVSSKLTIEDLKLLFS